MWLTLYIYSVVVYMNSMTISHEWVIAHRLCIGQDPALSSLRVWGGTTSSSEAAPSCSLGRCFLWPRSLYSVLPRAGGVTPDGYQSGQHASVCHLLSGGQPRTEVALWTSSFSLFLSPICAVLMCFYIFVWESDAVELACVSLLCSALSLFLFLKALLVYRIFLCSILTHDRSWSKEWRHLLILQMCCKTLQEWHCNKISATHKQEKSPSFCHMSTLRNMFMWEIMWAPTHTSILEEYEAGNRNGWGWPLGGSQLFLWCVWR